MPKIAVPYVAADISSVAKTLNIRTRTNAMLRADRHRPTLNCCEPLSRAAGGAQLPDAEGRAAESRSLST